MYSRLSFRLESFAPLLPVFSGLKSWLASTVVLYLFVKGWSDFFHDPVHLLTFCPYDPSAFLTRATQCWLNTPIGNSGSSPLLCMFCKKHRCWKQNRCHVDGTVPRALETLRLASAWCTPADAGNMRTASKEWYEAFEHTPDETTTARIELNHAEVLCTDDGSEMGPILDSTKPHGQIICSEVNPSGTDFLIAHHDCEWN